MNNLLLTGSLPIIKSESWNITMNFSDKFGGWLYRDSTFHFTRLCWYVWFLDWAAKGLYWSRYNFI